MSKISFYTILNIFSLSDPLSFLMKQNVNFLIMWLSVLFLMIACNSGSKNYDKMEKVDPEIENLQKWAGTYAIKSKGDSSYDKIVAYELNKDGKAIWYWSNFNAIIGALMKDKKFGTWTANENGFTINIERRDTIVPDTYKLKSGILTSTTIANKYLKRTK